MPKRDSLLCKAVWIKDGKKSKAAFFFDENKPYRQRKRREMPPALTAFLPLLTYAFSAQITRSVSPRFAKAK